MALYALMLVMLGSSPRGTAINRGARAGADVVGGAEAWMSDVWELGFLCRIVAFIGLGILLLSMSLFVLTIPGR